MTVFNRDSEKHALLQESRGVSFEEVVRNVELGNEIDILDLPNQGKYPGQKISVVVIESYVYWVPFRSSRRRQARLSCALDLRHPPGDAADKLLSAPRSVG